MYKLILSGMFDVAGAALFAFGIALGVSAVVAGQSAAWAGVAIIAGVAVRAVAADMLSRVAVGQAQAISAGLRTRLFPALLGGRMASALSTGENAAMAIDNVAAVEERALRFQPVRVMAGLAPLVIAAIVALASWVSAAIMLATLLPFVLGMILAGSAARRASDRQLDALGALSGLFVDRIANLPLIRHFGAQERVTRQVRGATAEVADRTVSVLRAAFLSGAVLEFFSALAVALIAVYCGFSLLGILPFDPPEKLDLEEAFFALAMAPEFYLPMRRLAAAYHEKQLGDAADKAQAPFLAYDASHGQSDASAKHAFAGIVVERLCLRLGDRAIGPVSLAIGMHDLVALTGPSGSGKSSVMAAIAGQLQPASGAITNMAGGSLDPGMIAWAAQRPLLVPGTLRENLALAAIDAPDDRIMQVAGSVGLGPVIARRGGLETVLDHRGSGLSGGERRRIGLARAMLTGRPAIFCDEPTADLDRASAEAMIALLRELARSHCILVATHDPVLAAVCRAEVML